MRATLAALLVLIAVAVFGIVVGYAYPSHPFLALSFNFNNSFAESGIAIAEIVTALVLGITLVVESLPFLGTSRNDISGY